ncbi:hypothetical protein [Winogradskyella pulchriflava]|uniref:Glycosyltransferase RgtA/B/C/D-like domain-containing protein n=1 Tax=Winogradskyella pulchriflava TaxID=1110688 RepID=A0ABV6QA20_9FLAO
MKHIFSKTLLVITIIYALIGAYFMLNLSIGSGDEQLFISDLNFINKEGWIKAIEKGISLPHALIVYPLSKILEPYIALRVTSVFCLLLLYYYIYRRNKPTLWFFIYFTFFIGTAKVFFIGTNDAFFIMALVIFLNEIHKVIIGKEWKPSLALIALVIAIFTRELIVIYMPILLLGMFIALKTKKIISKQIIAPSIVLVMCLIVNIPAFMLNGKPSYDAKKPPENVNVNWTQRQYLAQLLVNEGKLPNYQHPSFVETQNYINENGEDALPKSLLQSLFFNPQLTILEFYKDFWSIIYFGSRQLSLILLIVIGCFFINIKKLSLLNVKNYIPFSLVALTSIFALLIISYVELRWLVPIFIMAIIYYAYLEKVGDITKKLSVANLALMLILIVYGVYRIVPELIMI